MSPIARLTVQGNELWWLSDGLGSHGDQPASPDEVGVALRVSFRFVQESESSKGLRAPQLGALHAILAYRSTEATDPITIVMPTGTGKTDTMVAAYSHSPELTLVVVPSDALRTQIAEKFATLGVLPTVGALAGTLLCPSVLVLTRSMQDASEVDEALGRANVVIATALVLTACSEAARSRIAERCKRLFVDEAHHVAARTWRAVADLFRGKEVVQFTATPYREDGQHLGGIIPYVYPLSLAQQNGYFSRINYHSVVALVDPDGAVAEAAVEQLRPGLKTGRVATRSSGVDA